MADHVWLYNADTDAVWHAPADYAPVARRRGWVDTDAPADPDADDTAEPAAEVLEAAAEAPPIEEGDAQTFFDPADHKLGEVKEYLNRYRENSPGEVERVIALERAGRNRKSITGDS